MGDDPTNVPVYYNRSGWYLRKIDSGVTGGDRLCRSHVDTMVRQVHNQPPKRLPNHLEYHHIGYYRAQLIFEYECYGVQQA